MVRAIMIVEMAGRPAEHLTAALEKHIGVLNNVKDIKVHSIKISEPKEIKQKIENGGDKMWTSFAEADFECNTFSRLSETMFDFMPSSIEVIEPVKLDLNIAEATDLLNNISGRMHRYDDVAKVLGERYKHMKAQLQLAQKILAEKDAEIAGLKVKHKKEKIVKKKVVKKKTKKAKKSS